MNFHPLPLALAAAFAFAAHSQAARAQWKAQPEQIGGVFLEGEAVRFQIENKGAPSAAPVRWAVSDFWKQRIAQGIAQGEVQGGTLELKLPKARGYFSLSLQAGADGPEKPIEASFAILPRFDKSELKDSPFGVMTHFAQGWNPDIIPLIERLGASADRDELYWNSVEPEPNRFAFEPRYQTYMDALRAHNIGSLVPLTFENAHYDEGQTPHTLAAFDAYARYGQQVLARYGEQIGAVEIWNEYNGSFCKGPACDDRAGTYTAMLKRAYPALKAARPGVQVLGLSTAGIPLPFIEKVFQAGGLQFMDGVSVHPYRYGSAPEGIEDQIERLQRLIKRYNGGRPKPVWVTEIGWFLKPRGEPGEMLISEEDQGKFLLRGYALLLSAGVQKSFWYLLRDYAEFGTMGLLRDENDARGRYAPKPAYVAFANMARQLSHARFVRREAAAKGIYSLLFERDSKQGSGRGKESVRLLWSLSPSSIALRAKAPLAVTDMMGAPQVLAPARGAVALRLSDAPLYVVGEAALPAFQPAPEDGVAVGDSANGFSSTQGGGGWSYGFFEAAAPDAAYSIEAWKPLPSYRVTDWKAEWMAGEGGPQWLAVSEDAAHPGASNGHAVWSVRRWASPFAGRVRVEGQCSRGSGGDGTGVRIFVDGREMFARQLGGGQPIQAAFDFSAEVKLGTVIDFAVTPGPAADVQFDAVSLTSTIRRLR